MVRTFLKGHAREAEQLHRKFYPLFRDLFIESNPGARQDRDGASGLDDRGGPASARAAAAGNPRPPRRHPPTNSASPQNHEHRTRRALIIVGSKGRMGEALIAPCRAGSASWNSSPASTRATTFSTSIDRCDVAHRVRASLASLRLLPSAPPITARLSSSAPPATPPRNAAAIAAAAQRIPIVFAPNFSVGVNLLFHLTQIAAETLGENYDQEVVEMHHRHKLDAPSGTARRLGEILAEAAGGTYDELTSTAAMATSARGPSAHDRHARPARRRCRRRPHRPSSPTIGERIELTHRASSRDTFASGALRAAQWVRTQKPGLYSMQDVLGLK